MKKERAHIERELITDSNKETEKEIWRKKERNVKKKEIELKERKNQMNARSKKKKNYWKKFKS